MKLLKLSGILLTCSALVACGNSGSSDSTTTAAKPASVVVPANVQFPTNIKNAAIHKGEVEFNTNGSLKSYATTIGRVVAPVQDPDVDGTEYIEGTGKKLTYRTGDPSDKKTKFVSINIDSAHKKYGAIAVYGSEAGVNYAVTTIVKDGLAAAGFVGNVSRDATFTGVTYKYLSAGSPVIATNGTITVTTNGKWIANFGPISLDGTIVKGGVEGLSSFGDMKGGFSGYDGQIGGVNTTFGGFAGANAAGTSVYSGVWGK